MTTTDAPAEDQSGLSPRDLSPSLRMMLRGPDGLASQLLLNGAAPLVAYQLLTRAGVPSVRALTLTAVFPVIGLGLQWARTRRLNGIAALSLVIIVIGVTGSLITNDPRFYLVRLSFGTAAFGLACLVSLLFARPLMFYLSRQVVAAGDARRAAYYDSLWATPSFRHSQRVMTITWGAGYLVEASARVVVAVSLPTTVVLVIEPLLGAAAFAGMLSWTIWYGRRRTRAAS
jgi:hypothetical protein